MNLFVQLTVYKHSTVNKAYKEGMEVNCKYVKRKQLAQYLSSDTLKKYKSNYGNNNNSNSGNSNSSHLSTGDEVEPVTSTTGGAAATTAAVSSKRKSSTTAETVSDITTNTVDFLQSQHTTTHSKKLKTKV